MGNNIKSFLIKDVQEQAEAIRFQYKGFVITLNQDKETNGDLNIYVDEYIPKSKDYSQAQIASFTIGKHLGNLNWEDTWFIDEEGN